MRKIYEQTYPCVDTFVSCQTQEALNNGFDEWTLIVDDVQNVGKVPLGLGGCSSVIPRSRATSHKPCPADLSAFDPRSET